MITRDERRARIDKALETVVSDFLHHDRKDDPELPLGMIEEALRENDPGPNMLASRFVELVTLRIPLQEEVIEGEVLKEVSLCPSIKTRRTWKHVI